MVALTVELNEAASPKAAGSREHFAETLEHVLGDHLALYLVTRTKWALMSKTQWWSVFIVFLFLRTKLVGCLW